MPGYYRVVVKRNGAFFFRTSKLVNIDAMVRVLSGLEASFTGPDFTVEVLAVDPLPQGQILLADQIAALKDMLKTSPATTPGDPSDD